VRALDSIVSRPVVSLCCLSLLSFALQVNGFRIMLQLLRILCPIVPSMVSITSIGGVAKVSALDFISALVGNLPDHLLSVVIGVTVESVVKTDRNR
jgi:hypothetical protein